jgi:hypothetical protein
MSVNQEYWHRNNALTASGVSSSVEQVMIWTFFRTLQVTECGVSCTVCEVNDNLPCGNYHCNQEPQRSVRITWKRMWCWEPVSTGRTLCTMNLLSATINKEMPIGGSLSRGSQMRIVKGWVLVLDSALAHQSLSWPHIVQFVLFPQMESLLKGCTFAGWRM